ncbi:MAG: N-acetylglucosamine kinase [Lawsonibacter sp.]
MGYFIGIDAGGTKTESVLLDETGRIWCRRVRLGCNPMDHGIPETYKRIQAAVEELVEQAPGPICGLYGGIAGLDRIELPMAEYLAQQFPLGHVRTEDDGFNLISGTLGHVDGCGMVCGTGSSLFARIGGEPALHIGGLGYLIDTGGSGFELGRDALKAAFRCLDGRGENTVLVELLTREFGKDPRKALLDIYSGGRPFIASLAHIVFEGANLGDEVSRAIVEEGADKLAELTVAAARHFTGKFPVVLSGGIPTAYPSYAALIEKKVSPQAELMLAQVPPVYGAAVEALWDAGIAADETVRQRFMEDYRRIKSEKGVSVLQKT